MKCLLVSGLHVSEISFVSAIINLQLTVSMQWQHLSLVYYKVGSIYMYMYDSLLSVGQAT